VGRHYDTVTFLSDLGTNDESVGVVHAVLRDLAPTAHVVDLAHDLPPFDVRAASLALARSVAYLPEGVIVAAVDPSPGERPAVAIEVADGAGIFVGPDNGVMAPGVAMAGGAQRAVALTNTHYHLGSPSSMLRVRDVFAPVAAHLCGGVDLSDLGEEVDPVLLMPAVVPLPRDDGETLVTEVLWVDRFGNAQLNVGPEDLTARWPVTVGSALAVTVRDVAGNPVRRVATWVEAFHEVSAGALGLLADSSGMLSLCAQRSSAAVEAGLAPGDQVVVAMVDPSDRPSAVTTPVNLRPGR
jgi:S-adenosyl-L-methionine hydrolase (adenosine-forming)